MMSFFVKRTKVNMRIILLFSLLLCVSCKYHKPLEQHQLLVPEFVQEDYPELYEVFQDEAKKPKKK